jgi:uncharacterized protein YndB with AHSA1/START domain
MRVIGYVDISCGAADVFAYVSDQTNGPAWQQGLVEVRRTTDGAIGVGTKHTFVRRLGRRQVTGDNEYVEFEPGRRVVFTFTSSDGLTGKGWYEVDALGTHLTRLDYGVEIRLQGLTRLASPLIERSIRREDREDTARLKEILERTNTSPRGVGL